jgi:hypothetical protein
VVATGTECARPGGGLGERDACGGLARGHILAMVLNPVGRVAAGSRMV